MEPILTFFFIIVCALLLVINRKLLAGKKQYIHAFDNIYEQLKCRYNMIPGLVDVSKIHLHGNQAAIAAVSSAKLRAEAVLAAASANLDDNALSSLDAVEAELNQALSHLQSVIKTYPALKKDKSVANLIDALEHSENRVAHAKQSYNHSAVSYNEMRSSFPANMFAGLLGHSRNAALLSFEDSTSVHITPRILL